MLPISTLPLLLASAAARSFFFNSGSQVTLDDKFQVPGENPLHFCQDPEDYSLAIKSVDLRPNPPEPGSKLVIEASGTFTQVVEEGAYVRLSIKYGLITLIKTTTDLCDQLEEVNEDCPIEGEKIIRKEVDIPKEVPPGTYSVLADVYTKDDKRVTCLETSIHFGG